MTETTILYTSIVFYVALTGLLALAGFAIPEGDFGDKPEFPSLGIDDVILNLLFFGIPFFLSLGVYIFQLFAFSLTPLIPTWLSAILFTPLVVILGYIFARLIRGN